MKEYILNIKFENWENQLWFMGDDRQETQDKWKNAINEISKLRDSSEDAISFQNQVIEYLKRLGFVRFQK